MSRPSATTGSCSAGSTTSPASPAWSPPMPRSRASTTAEALVGFGLGGPGSGCPRAQFAPHFAAARAAGLHSVPHSGESTGPRSVGGGHPARRRADRARDVVGAGPGAAGPPRRARHPPRGVPDEQHRHPRRRAARGAPDPGHARRRCRRHGEQRRPADVRHHAEPRVRDRGRAPRPRRRRGRRPGGRGGRRLVRARPRQVGPARGDRGVHGCPRPLP